MNNPIALLFLAIQQRINDQVPAIRHIDQDLSQFEIDRPPVSWPAVLIDMDDFTYKAMGENCQTATGNIVLRLGFDPHSSTSQNTPDAYRKKALAYYDLEFALHQALQGWEPAYIVDDEDLLGDISGALNRVSARTEKRHDLLRVRVITYTIGIDDYSTKTGRTYIPAAIDISTTI